MKDNNVSESELTSYTETISDLVCNIYTNFSCLYIGFEFGYCEAL
jgi:hypothetical protein